MKAYETVDVSIIIPIYNGEAYIKNIIAALKRQTLQNFEVLLINDCSTDNTINYLQNLPDFYSIYTNEKNSGAGFSRNIGIKKAKGKYICFIDVDDVIPDNYVQELYTSVSERNADIAICDIILKNEKMTKSSFSFHNKKELIANPFIASPCAKIFSKECFEKLTFVEGIINEDVATIIPIIAHAKTIVYTEETYYMYVQNAESVQNRIFDFNKFNVFPAVKMALERMDSKDKEQYEDIIIYNQILLFFIYSLITIGPFLDRYKYLKTFYRKSKGINLVSNGYFNNHLKTHGKINRIYYRILLFLVSHRLIFISNITISLYQIAKKLDFRKRIISKEIAMKDLISAATKQKTLKSGNIKISAIIPNYNYKHYLYERIYSILYQDYKIDEIIILDDCSSDGSQELIMKIVEELKDAVNISFQFNDTNSGNVFNQWEKAFQCASNDYVWIAEADDYCTPSFAKDLINKMENEDELPMIAYCKTQYINKKTNIILKDSEKLIDLDQTGHWASSYSNLGYDEIMKYMYLNCTIINVSSVLFKNSENNYVPYFIKAKEFKQVGDWMFYIQMLSEGNILYSTNANNYYRVHGDNTTLVTKKKEYLREIERVHEYLNHTYTLSSKQQQRIKERYKELEQEWDLIN
ncbi:glycosyltransferase involved in cell wall biosynthesis [Breznakia sp. PF5-3]|uniref:glycosyltransferase family 2 protein n=1 Tax=unclassified Breznakia TaxID=2623764 RepID=UPI002405EAC0|nr:MULTISPECIES: glycosyltransferase [unclassified Breznakia]MDF9824985.1 glycosyltransferase involved in cell wall biosynthesis [Breznakia sp. PM6-1]MDF9835822.1 glycosyltransferase involved in cell wall biosynthesis [Breznakia sp. PF5-3]MDF9836926.1 glycosyltransferase involved in cell wall biosynthesis [Breznakia sp. PFB2-8]MDF9859872.1 glycosyltransferase involved in cell wall biosynthesis [Breznakia sp. PH5-24]